MEFYLLVTILALVYLLGVITTEYIVNPGDTWVEGVGVILWPFTVALGVCWVISDLTLAFFRGVWKSVKALDQWLIKRVWGF